LTLIAGYLMLSSSQGCLGVTIMKSKLLPVASAIGIAVATASAHADTFTSSSEFALATTELTVENYGTYSAGTLVPSGSTLGSLSYRFNTASNLGGVINPDIEPHVGTTADDRPPAARYSTVRPCMVAPKPC
jgi:hypothetical protein